MQILDPSDPLVQRLWSAAGHQVEDALLGILVTLKFENHGFNPVSLTLVAY